MVIDSFHSKLPETKTHHNNDECALAKNIQPHNKETGNGGHPLCLVCENLKPAMMSDVA